MNGTAFFFFVVLAAVQVATYLGVRRQWMALGAIAACGIAISIVLSFMLTLAQGQQWVMAMLIGLVLGGMINGMVLAVAWYFQRNEMAARKRNAAE
jgi:hypothetical protein